MNRLIKKIGWLACLATLSYSAVSFEPMPRKMDHINWGSLAISQMILDIYGVYINQYELSEEALPGMGLYLEDTSSTSYSVADILSIWGGISTTYYNRPISYQELQYHLANGKPVIAEVDGSRVLITSMRQSTIVYIEPCPYPELFGRHEAYIRDFSTNWQKTLVMNTEIGQRSMEMIPEEDYHPEYTLLGFNDLLLNDFVTCYADTANTNNYCDIGSNWKFGYYNADSVGLRMGYKARAGSAFAHGPAFFREFSYLQDGLVMTSFNDLKFQNGVEVYGNVYEGHIPFRGFGCGTIDFSAIPQSWTNIEPDQPRQTITPGTYYNYTIKQRSPVRLVAGNYYFHGFLCDGCTLEFDAAAGPIRIYVQDEFLMNGAQLSFIHGGAGDLLLGYLGNKTIFVNSNFYGTILAPYAELVLGQTSKEFIGTFQAKNLTVHQHSVVRHVPFAHRNSQ